MKLCFVHIPKAGGTSVTRALRKSFGAKQVLRAGNSRETRDLRKGVTSSQGYSVVSAHLTSSVLHELFPKAALITLVRDPVARAVSIYKHLSTRTMHPLYEMNKSLSFKEHLVWMRDNGKVRRFRQVYFVDRPDVRAFPLERMEGLFKFLAQHYEAKRTSIPHTNAIKMPVPIEEGDKALIRELYARDFDLYETVLRQTESQEDPIKSPSEHCVDSE